MDICAVYPTRYYIYMRVHVHVFTKKTPPLGHTASKNISTKAANMLLSQQFKRSFLIHKVTMGLVPIPFNSYSRETLKTQ